MERLEISRPIVWYMNADRAQTLVVDPASLVICGPITASVCGLEAAERWRALAQRADFVLPVPLPPSTTDAQRRDDFWDEECLAMRVLLSAGACERALIMA